jgi:hypothetical protein
MSRVSKERLQKIMDKESKANENKSTFFLSHCSHAEHELQKSRALGMSKFHLGQFTTKSKE